MASFRAPLSTSCRRCSCSVSRLITKPAVRTNTRCHASNYGFLEDEAPVEEPSDLIIPKSAFGLSLGQMAAMGITGSAVQRVQQGITEASLRASACYVGEDAKISTAKTPTTMHRGGGGVLTPGRAPPDLPSLLLDARIVYIGMPLVASVTELVISELLWLNYNQPEKPVYVYLNSIGSQSANQESVGFETEAYAILDTMQYIRPDMYTLVIGAAFGNACMLLAAGKQGKRAALPHSRIKMAPPRLNRSFGKTTDIMIKANELEQNTDTYVEFMAKFTGQDEEKVAKDCGRDMYFTPQKAIEYGIIDRVIQPEDAVQMDAKDYEGALDMMRSQRGRSGGGGAEAGSA